MPPPSLLEQLASTPLSGSNAGYVEALYEQYLRDPAAVDEAWRRYFDGLPGQHGRGERTHSEVIAEVARRMQSGPPGAAAVTPAAGAASEKQAAVSRLMQI